MPTLLLPDIGEDRSEQINAEETISVRKQVT